MHSSPQMFKNSTVGKRISRFDALALFADALLVGVITTINFLHNFAFNAGASFLMLYYQVRL